MKIIIEIELGNEAMQTPGDVVDALSRAAYNVSNEPFELGETERIRDRNGNTVGEWEVSS